MTDDHDDEIDPAEVPDRIAETAAAEEDGRRTVPLRWFWVAIVVACLGFAALGAWGQQYADTSARRGHEIQAAHSTAAAAVDQAGDLADQVQAACKSTSSLHDALTKLGLCQQAASVKSQPPPKSTKATPRQVSSVAIIDNSLVVTYTDGSTANLGQVVGRAGKIGATGQPGKPGKDATGKPGKDGDNGADGVGIVSALPNKSGHLVVTYTDGRTVDAGKVVGPPGRDGQNGAPGISVTGVSVSGSYHLLVTLSNGAVTDAGELPAGPPGKDGTNGHDGKDGAPGKDGRGIDSSYCGDNGRWTNTYSDGKTGDGGVCRETSTTTVTAPPSPTPPPSSSSSSPQPSSTSP